MSTLTPGGTYTKLPPDHTALFSAANLLSSGGTTVPKYCRTRSGCSRTAVSGSQKITPWRVRLSRRLWYTTSESYWAPTPDRNLASASGMPRRSKVSRM